MPTSLKSICNLNGSLSVHCAPTAMAASVPLTSFRAAVSVAVQDGAVVADSRSHSASGLGRREALLSGLTALVSGLSINAGPALADFNEDYKNETEAVIERVKSTLALEKSDPSKADAVANLRQTSNDWVAKYRREKGVAGRPSFSNMYSVLNALSGHYISFGPNYPIPGKRKDRILEEIKDAEKALKRGR